MKKEKGRSIRSSYEIVFVALSKLVSTELSSHFLKFHSKIFSVCDFMQSSHLLNTIILKDTMSIREFRAECKPL